MTYPKLNGHTYDAATIEVRLTDKDGKVTVLHGVSEINYQPVKARKTRRKWRLK